MPRGRLSDGLEPPAGRSSVASLQSSANASELYDGIQASTWNDAPRTSCMELDFVLSSFCALWRCDVWWAGCMLLHGCFSFRKVVGVNFPYSPASQPTGSSDVRVCVLGGEGFSCSLHGGTRFSTEVVRDTSLLHTPRLVGTRP